MVTHPATDPVQSGLTWSLVVRGKALTACATHLMHAILLLGELNNAVNNHAVYTTLLQQQLSKSKLNWTNFLVTIRTKLKIIFWFKLILTTPWNIRISTNNIVSAITNNCHCVRVNIAFWVKFLYVPLIFNCSVTKTPLFVLAKPFVQFA